MSSRTRKVVAVAAALVIAVGTAGTAYAVQHRDKALPRTHVAGLDVGGRTRADIAAAVRARADSVRVTVRTPSGDRSATLADLGYAVDADATARAVIADRGLSSYAVALVQDQSVAPVVTSDAAILARYAAGLVPADRALAKDATVRLGADRASFVVTPAVTGARIETTALGAAAAAAARDLASRTVEVGLVDVAPAVSTSAAQAVADHAGRLVAAPVKVTVGATTFTPTAVDKAAWVDLRATAMAASTVGSTAGSTAGAAGPVVNAKAVAAWVAARAATATIRAENGIRLVSTTGAVLRVKSEKVDGRTITNAADLAAKLRAAFAAGAGFTGAFTSTVVPAAWKDRQVAAGAESLAYPAAPGEKWIDVNLSRHTMTAYIGGQAVNGPLAMVNGASATPSLVGTYFINRKYVSDRMRGRNTDGTTYDNPAVPWVSYFHGGYALHGAPWRSSFGYAASHGCINLPVSVAKWVYEWAPIGTPVVSHF